MHNDRNNILNSWIMVERLSEGDLDNNNTYDIKVKSTDINYYLYFQDIIFDQHIKKGGGIELYFDIFQYKEVIEKLREKYQLETHYEEFSVDKKYSFALFFDHELNIDIDRTIVSASAYIRYFNVVPTEEEFLAFESELKNEIHKYFYDVKDQESFNKAFQKVLNANFLVKTENANSISLDHCRYHIIKDYSKSSELHSFFIKDLQKAQKIHTTNLDLYLRGSYSVPRVNLDSNKKSKNFNPEIFKNILMPKNYPLGRFPSNTKYALSLMQQIAVNLACGYDSQNLRSVNGPPGTGKTTLLKDVFADLIVKQAYKISILANKKIEGSNDTIYNEWNNKKTKIGELPKSISEKNIVVASSNNGAVQNIVNELPLSKEVDKNLVKELVDADYFYKLSNSTIKTYWAEDKDKKGKKKWQVDETPSSDPTENKNWGLFSLEGGKRDNVEKIMGYLKKIVDHNSVGEKGYQSNPKIYQDYLKEYSKVENLQNIAQKYADRYYEYLNNCEVRNKLKEQYTAEKEKIQQNRDRNCQIFEEQLHSKEQELTPLENSFKQLQINEIPNLEKQISTQKGIVDIISNQKPGHFKKRKEHNERLQKELDNLSSFNNQLSDLYEQQKELQTKIDPLIQEIEHLKDQITEENKQFESWNSNYKNRLENLEKEIISFEKDTDNSKRSPLDINNEYRDLQLMNPWFNEEYRKAQSHLFIKALEVRKNFILDNIKNIDAAVKIWNQQKKYLDNVRVIVAAWNWINLAIPVVSSTFASFNRMFENLPPETIGHLFIDEAGQALPQAAVGAIFRSKNVMVVGDPSQIKPVLTTDDTTLQLLKKAFDVGETYLSENASTQTLVDAVSQYGFYRDQEQTEESWIGIPLWVHRRCKCPMFNISNDISYNGYMVLGMPEEAEAAHGKAGWFDIKGTAYDKYVPEQGEFLKNKIQSMIKDNPDINDHEKKDIIYVISPFRNVAYRLSKELSSIGFTRKQQEKPTNVGTIHTFQGKEAPIVFLVLGADDNSKGAASWAVSEANMMNVAATRAKEEFYIIGDKSLYLDLNSDVISDTYRDINVYKNKYPELVDESTDVDYSTDDELNVNAAVAKESADDKKKLEEKGDFIENPEIEEIFHSLAFHETTSSVESDTEADRSNIYSESSNKKMEKEEKQYNKKLIIGNRKQHNYHKVTCKYAPRDPKKRVEFYSVKEAIEEGYKPCPTCFPKIK